MRARWVMLLVVIAGAAPARAQPEATCAAACQRYAQCKLSNAEACVASCKRAAVETTPEGRARLVALVRASCDQLAAAQKAQAQPASRTKPASQTQPAPRAQPAPQVAQTQPVPQSRSPTSAPPAPPAPPRPQPPESDRQVWKCTSEGSYEILRKRQIYWTPAQTSAFGFGKTQQLALTMANASCAKHMNSMMALESITSQTRMKMPCRPTRCTPPP